MPTVEDLLTEMNKNIASMATRQRDAANSAHMKDFGRLVTNTAAVFGIHAATHSTAKDLASAGKNSLNVAKAVTMAGGGPEDPVALAAGVVAGVVTAMVQLPGIIKGWAEGLLDSQREVAKFSGSLQAVFAQQYVREFMRENEYGEATAGSTGELSESLSNLKDNLVPIRTIVTNIENSIATDLVDGMNEILRYLQEWMPFLKPAEKKNAETNYAWDEAQEIRKQQEARNRRPFMRGPF